MSVPNRQIGWNTESNLLWNIAKQIEKIGRQIGLLTSPVLPKLYGSFYDTTTQTATINQPTAMHMNTIDLSSGVSVEPDINGHPSIITVDRTGVYNIQFSAQLVREQGGSSKNVNIYLKKGSTIIPWTATYVSMESNAVYVVAAWNWLIELTPSDELQIIWVQNDAIELVAAPASETHPEIPSLIVTVTQVN